MTPGRLMRSAALAVTAAAATVASAQRSRHRIDLTDKTVVVTGGTAGLGLETARGFAHLGAKVAVCGRDATTLQGAVDDLEGAGVPVLGQVCDVRDPDDVERMIEAVETQLGPIDVLVNNAGVIELGEITSDAEAVFRELLDVMFWGTARPTRRCTHPQRTPRWSSTHPGFHNIVHYSLLPPLVFICVSEYFLSRVF
jgi:NAD(P)-dependent dehydrogenase (short-subunit alcohol dehydrogenase family)